MGVGGVRGGHPRSQVKYGGVASGAEEGKGEARRGDMRKREVIFCNAKGSS